MHLIRGAELFAPGPLGKRDVLIGGGKILAIDQRLDSAALGRRVALIEAEGLRLLPGLVDSLVHISGGGGEGGFASRSRPLQAEHALRGGVTSLIGALGTDDVTRSLADLLACCRSLTEHGLSAYALSGSYHLPLRTLTGRLRDDLVLIPDLIGVGEIAIADHRGSQPTVAELARIAAEARVGGMLAGKAGTVLIHLGDAEDRLTLLEAVVEQHAVSRTQFLPTHCNRSRALLDHSKDWLCAGGYVDLTCSTTEQLLADGEVPAAQALLELLDQCDGAGQVSLSSDAQASLPQFDAEGRLLHMAEADIGSLLATLQHAWQLRPERFSEILAAATSTPATIWGLSSKGRIRVGGDADLLLLDGRDNTLRAVVAGGRYSRF
ncbi:beta-aspartyl-peptidase [Pseudomarimonas arenosa]|uniref:Isoaspartyl dipeptidase n=1 Tax=Pseudomarimonas arenosa TaxID=2774145 RepID=A0AAW3ZI86_9GAMM|nr:beta-aspartyl-peptidase [Pseudomarimonas arenosa]MBD8525798.1 beta-aspartyl-peptidase [Pseudomarimonas arenosa]